MTGTERQILLGRLYEAALENIEKSKNPPASELEGGYPSAAAKSYAEAARAHVQALMTASSPAGGRR